MAGKSELKGRKVILPTIVAKLVRDEPLTVVEEYYVTLARRRCGEDNKNWEALPPGQQQQYILRLEDNWPHPFRPPTGPRQIGL
jgi:hypothetical protein